MPAIIPSTMHDDQEPAYRCGRCRRLLFDTELDRYVCRLCEDRAHQQISALPNLFRNLSSALAPGSSGNNSGRVSSTREAPLPVNVHVLDMIGPGGIVAELQAIEDNWRSARGRTIGPRNDGVRWFASTRAKSPNHAIAEHATYIAYNLMWACESHEEVAYDLGVISKAHAKAEGAILGNRPRRVLVSCLAEYDDGSTCGAELRIDVTAASTFCSECGARWGRDDWLRLHAASQASAA
jgi:DNA-directed RNA polymerase subunit RPC12/RpoP